jgi:peptidoglycan/xylan/chitin deacetylase (PgdA/CDA1 family)
MYRALSIFALGVTLLAANACSQTQEATSTAPASVQTAPTEPIATPPAAESAPVAPETFTQKLQPKLSYSSVHADGKYIAMTFDDGPSAANTPRLLDILAKRNIKVTFFMVGQCVVENPAIVKRILAEGHEIGNHSWSHPAFAKMSDDAVKSQIDRTEAAIEQACGLKTDLLRPPYGSITKRQEQWIHNTFGMNIIMWEVDPLDWKFRNAAHVESEILKQVRPGAIILSHDIHATTVDAMPATLDALLARGYKFVTVSELLAMDKPVPPKPPVDPSAPAKKTASRQAENSASDAKPPAI